MTVLALAACSAPADLGPEKHPHRVVAESFDARGTGEKRTGAEPEAQRTGADRAGLTRSAGRAEDVAMSDGGVEPADAAAGENGEAETSRIFALDGSVSTSLGSCRDGRLVGGVALPLRGRSFLHNPRRPPEARFATVETVQAILRAAEVVAREIPGPPLVVNDLGYREGGPIAQHGSHQNGLDADILFFYLDARGKPMQAVGVPLDPQGWGWDFKDLTIAEDDVRLRLDPRRTWRFIQALLQQREATVQRIFIVEHLRSLLLEEAQRSRAPLDARQRFEEITCQPSTPHDDHMHVRFFCTAEDIPAGCTDSHPIYPWRRAELAALGVEPVLATFSRSQRKLARARTTSPAQARRRAGRMHRRVRQFLDKRKSWLKKPSPGRPYCP
jgi:penicillin-insensitive murein endopeptidase